MLHFLMAVAAELPGGSCRRAARISSKAMDGKLSLFERADWALHLAICRLCRRYRSQLETVRLFARDSGERGLPRASLSESSSRRIRESLRG